MATMLSAANAVIVRHNALPNCQLGFCGTSSAKMSRGIGRRRVILSTPFAGKMESFDLEVEEESVSECELTRLTSFSPLPALMLVAALPGGIKTQHSLHIWFIFQYIDEILVYPVFELFLKLGKDCFLL
ncbi:unnamed protein product [Rhodiola kirilowii]